MKSLFILSSIIITISLVHAQEPASLPRDTVFQLAPIIVNPIEAHERESPVTFSNLSRRQIAERYSTLDVPVLLSELPSITFYSENGNGIGYNYINLRGFDQRRLSIMINGVPQNDPEDHNMYWIDVPDLMASTGNIQVQRGAGNAFYGPPAIGGSVNLITDPFVAQPKITVATMFGFQEFDDKDSPGSTSLSLNTRKYLTSINSGLINQHYMLYGKLGKILSDGYRANSWVELDSYFLGAVRIDSNMTTRIHLFGGPLSDGLAYFGVPKFANSDPNLRRQNLSDWGLDSTGQHFSYSVPRRPQETETFSQPHYEILNEWRISPSLTINNTLFYYSGDGSFDYDASWADTSMLRIGYNYGIPASQNPTNTLVRAFVGNKQWGWLPRVEVNHTDGSLTVGTELRIHRSVHWGKIQFAEQLPQDFDPDYHFYEYNGEKDIFSFYMHELYHPQEQLTLMGDVQFAYNRYGLENEKYLGNNFSLSYFFVNPRFGVNYNINQTWNTYFSLAYTSREPRLTNLYEAESSYFGATPQFRADTAGGTIRYDFSDPLAHPEHLLDIELGTAVKTSALQTSLTLYWMEFVDELVENGQVDIFGQPVTGNAERTRHIGIEADGNVSLTDAISISGNFTASTNRLIHYSVIDDNGNRISLDENPIAGFPDLLANFRITYKAQPVTASLSMKYVGPFYTDNFINEENKNNDYTVFDASLLYQLPRVFDTDMELRGEVRNIFDRLYLLNGEGNAFFPAAERNFLVGVSMNL